MYNRLTGDSLGLDLLPKVSNKVFIEGLFDYTGELRRKFLGYLLEGELDKAREIVDELSRLYDVLSIFIVKSYYLRDFRRRLDQLRSQLIRSLEDLANALYSRRGVK
jgi:predicted translin family RNA/ssDNA-binding protein